jgi:hypothetical protein
MKFLKYSLFSASNSLKHQVTKRYPRYLFLKLPILIGLLTIFLYTKPALAESLAGAESSESPNYLAQQLDITSEFENNRMFGNRIIFQGVYCLLLPNHYQFKTGISYNTVTNLVNTIFIEVGYQKIKDSQFSINLKFLGNQYGEYGKAANSIIPYCSWQRAKYYLDLGINCRFLNLHEQDLWNIFDYSTPVAEVMPYYRWGYRLVESDRYTMIIEVNNFDEMNAGNLGTYGFFQINKFKGTENSALLLNLGFRPTGSFALSATYYKIIIICGVEVKL